MKNLSSNNPIKINFVYIMFLFIMICSISIFLLISSTSDSFFLLKKAYAHAIPVNQTPAPDSIFEKDKLPSKVIINFSERPVPRVSTIEVLNEKNERIDNGNFVIIGDHDREAMTTLDTTKLTDGVYTVSWMAQSADDGHIAKGSYVFGIGNVGVSSSAKTSTSSIKGLTNDQNYRVQAITSSLDGLIKWPLIISQITVIDVIFSHLFLWDLFGKKIIINKNKLLSNSSLDIITNNIMSTSRYYKRFIFILVIVCVTIIITTNVLLFLQVIELVPNDNMSYYASTFLSLMQGPSGFLWLIRTITAIIIIVCIIVYYYFINNTTKTESNKINNYSDFHKHEKKDRINFFKKIKLNNQKLVPLLLLSISFIAGSISIFANSVTSHNAAVEFFPTIAIFFDWIHFMGVSLWIGGLFYMSAILLTVIKEITKNHDQNQINESIEAQKKKTIIPTETISINVKKRFVFNYYLALLLPRFSLIATLSLGVIGISGIYMAWINIHSFNFLVNSDYGQILIIKLVSIVPLIILGAYHQLKLHNTIVNIASLRENDSNNNIDKRNIIDLKNSKKNLKTKQEQTESNKINIFGKFSKTIKIESLIAIGVLLVASLLTTTSPP